MFRRSTTLHPHALSHNSCIENHAHIHGPALFVTIDICMSMHVQLHLHSIACRERPVASAWSRRVACPAPLQLSLIIIVIIVITEAECRSSGTIMPRRRVRRRPLHVSPFFFSLCSISLANRELR